MKVGGEVARCREDTFLLLSFAFSVELLPPFCHKMELWLEVCHYFYLLSSFWIKCLTNGSIACCNVLSERNICARSLFHVLCALYKLLNVEACHCDRQQANRCKHRETAANVVWNNESLVTFACCCRTCCTLYSVGNGNDNVFCFLLATLIFALFLQQTESKGSLRGCSRLGNVDDTETLILQELGEFVQIILADVVASVKDCRILLVVQEPCKAIAQGFNDGTCP